MIQFNVHNVNVYCTDPLFFPILCVDHGFSTEYRVENILNIFCRYSAYNGNIQNV